jgi:hypothetical protein
MKTVMAGNVEHSIKVTRLPNCWGVRCFTNNSLNQEIRVKSKEDISIAVSEMLRYEDKCGNFSQMAAASRNRFFNVNKYRSYKNTAVHVKI